MPNVPNKPADPELAQVAGVPLTVVIGSAEFDEAVAAAVRLAMQSTPAPKPHTVAVQAAAVIPVTSVDCTKAGADDLTVRFNRFCTFQNAGYQRGQEAGFPRAAAEELHLSRAATITHDPRRLGPAGAPLVARAA